MRTAVVYYSLEGNTRAAAERLASRLGAQTFEVKTVKAYPRKGLAKFLAGGKDAMFGALPSIEALEMDPSEFDLVVIAVPVWAGKAAAPINSFLQGRSFGGTKVALVVASASGDAQSCVQDLAKKLGKNASGIATLSLKNPGKMPEAELAEAVDRFAEQLEAPTGGAF